jgi:hypothetical protein
MVVHSTQHEAVLDELPYRRALTSKSSFSQAFGRVFTDQIFYITYKNGGHGHHSYFILYGNSSKT